MELLRASLTTRLVKSFKIVGVLQYVTTRSGYFSY